MGRMDGLMQMVAICQDFGWTYGEYQDQPNDFITLIKEKMRIDQKAQELQNKRMNNG